MKRGKITIKANEMGNISIHLELVNSTVWMTTSEIAYMFNVFTSTVTSNTNAIFKNKELFEHEVTLCHENVVYYNLDLIIALSFRIKGGYARHFREWVREQITKSIMNSNKVPIIIQLGENTITN